MTFTLRAPADIRTQISTHGADWLTKYGDLWKTQAARLKERFGEKIEEVRFPVDYPTDVPVVYVQKDAIVEVLRFARSESGFEYGFLADITATDELNEQSDWRFEVVYNLLSPTSFARIRFKVRVPENVEVPTAIDVWPGANWAEREVWDMFGVRFAGHPNLRRILMDERWEGHPLRKDYPLRGYQVFTEPTEIHPEAME
ncbi:MAG: NADH-quinone oxidoreductase subunit C [Oligoflexia bacterium]|nr:NADH-quinone oxidoreductase subunit C [Oligoflexia bacterium]